MTGPLSLERFRTLADAYGGAIARWPEPDRSAAAAIAHEPEAAAILRDAFALDGVLDDWRQGSPSVTLRDGIIARAPLSVASITARARVWWSSIGIAAALAGAVAGVAAVAVAAPFDMASETGTSFGDVAREG